MRCAPAPRPAPQSRRDRSAWLPAPSQRTAASHLQYPRPLPLTRLPPCCALRRVASTSRLLRRSRSRASSTSASSRPSIRRSCGWTWWTWTRSCRPLRVLSAPKWSECRSRQVAARLAANRRRHRTQLLRRAAHHRPPPPVPPRARPARRHRRQTYLRAVQSRRRRRRRPLQQRPLRQQKRRRRRPQPQLPPRTCSI
jgi:hypothetical protein